MINYACTCVVLYSVIQNLDPLPISSEDIMEAFGEKIMIVPTNVINLYNHWRK